MSSLAVRRGVGSMGLNNTYAVSTTQRMDARILMPRYGRTSCFFFFDDDALKHCRVL